MSRLFKNCLLYGMVLTYGWSAPCWSSLAPDDPSHQPFKFPGVPLDRASGESPQAHAFRLRLNRSLTQIDDLATRGKKTAEEVQGFKASLGGLLDQAEYALRLHRSLRRVNPLSPVEEKVWLERHQDQLSESLGDLGASHQLPIFSFEKEMQGLQEEVKNFSVQTLYDKEKFNQLSTLHMEIGGRREGEERVATLCVRTIWKDTGGMARSQLLFDRSFRVGSAEPDLNFSDYRDSEDTTSPFDQIRVRLKKNPEGPKEGVSFKLKTYQSVRGRLDTPIDLDRRGIDLKCVFAPNGSVSLLKLTGERHVWISFKNLSLRPHLITHSLSLKGLLVFERVSLLQNFGQVFSSQGLFFKEIGKVQLINPMVDFLNEDPSVSQDGPSFLTQGECVIQAKTLDLQEGKIKSNKDIVFLFSSLKSNKFLGHTAKIQARKKVALYAPGILHLRHGDIRAESDLLLYAGEGIEHHYTGLRSRFEMNLETFGPFNSRGQTLLMAKWLSLSARSAKIGGDRHEGSSIVVDQTIDLRADEKLILKKNLGIKDYLDTHRYHSSREVTLSAEKIKIRKIGSQEKITLNVGTFLYPENPFIMDSDGEVYIYHNGKEPVVLKKKLMIPGALNIISRVNPSDQNPCLSQIRVRETVFAQKGIRIDAPSHQLFLEGPEVLKQGEPKGDSAPFAGILASKGPITLTLYALDLCHQACLIVWNHLTVTAQRFKNMQSILTAASLEFKDLLSFENLAGHMSILGTASVKTHSFHHTSLVAEQTSLQSIDLSNTLLGQIWRTSEQVGPLTLSREVRSLKAQSALFETGGDLTILSQSLHNKGGLLSSYGHLSLHSQTEIRNENLMSERNEILDHGHIRSLQQFVCDSATLYNSGRLGGREGLIAQVRQNFVNAGGLESQGSISLRAAGEFKNDKGGEIRTDQELKLFADHIHNFVGRIEAGGRILFEGRSFTNTRGEAKQWAQNGDYRHETYVNPLPGTIVGGQDIVFRVTTGLNFASHIHAAGGINYEGQHIENRPGMIEKQNWYCYHKDTNFWGSVTNRYYQWGTYARETIPASMTAHNAVTFSLSGHFLNQGFIDAQAFQLQGETFYNGIFGQGDEATPLSARSVVTFTLTPGDFDQKFFKRTDQDSTYIVRRRSLFGDVQIGPSETLASSGVAPTSPIRQLPYLGDYDVLTHALQQSLIQQKGCLYRAGEEASRVLSLSHQVFLNTLHALENRDLASEITQGLYQDFISLRPFNPKFQSVLEKPIFWPRKETKEDETYITFDLILPTSNRSLQTQYGSGHIHGDTLHIHTRGDQVHKSGLLKARRGLTVMAEGELRRETSVYTKTHYLSKNGRRIEEKPGPQEAMICTEGTAILLGKTGYSEVGSLTQTGQDLVRGSILSVPSLQDLVLTTTKYPRQKSFISRLVEGVVGFSFTYNSRREDCCSYNGFSAKPKIGNISGKQEAAPKVTKKTFPSQTHVGGKEKLIVRGEGGI